MARCPNCDAEIGADAVTCPQCDADFQGPSSWKPRATSWKRFPSFWTGPQFTEYEHDEYEALIERVSRRPLQPAVGLPLFGALFAMTLLAKKFLGPSFAGLTLIALLLLFPCYVVQLLMLWRMREHQKLALRNGTQPSYVPWNARGWAAVYFWTFLAAAYAVLALDRIFT